jgi:hypothetical protein
MHSEGNILVTISIEISGGSTTVVERNLRKACFGPPTPITTPITKKYYWIAQRFPRRREN